MSRRLLLASRSIPVLAEHLQARGRHALLVPTAANPLGEPGIADEVEPEPRVRGCASNGSILTARPWLRCLPPCGRLTSLRSRVAIPSIRGAARRGARRSVTRLARRSRPERSTSATAPGRSSPGRRSSRCASQSRLRRRWYSSSRPGPCRRTGAPARQPPQAYGAQRRSPCRVRREIWIVPLRVGELVIQDGDRVDLHRSVRRGI